MPTDAPLALLLAALAGAACSAHGPEPVRVTPASEAPATGPIVTPPRPSPSPDDPPRTSCRAAAPASQHPLSRAVLETEIAGRTFALAWRRAGADVETVIVSLDAAGALVITPVPVPYADPLALGGDPRGLVILSVANRGHGTLLRVALDADGALRPGKPTPLPAVPWGWPARVESDGATATLHHTLATPDQTAGAEARYTIELATGRVRATTTAPPGTTTHCHAGACTTAQITRVEDAPGRAALTAGPARLELTIGSTCPTLYPVTAGDALLLVGPGDPWRAVLAEPTPPSLREVAIDPSLPAMPGCGRALYAFPSDAHPGLVDGWRGPRSLLTYDRAGASFGAPEALPEQSYDRWTFAPHADGVVEVAWKGGHGMMHSPSDREVRRYFKHWYFEGGQVALLRREGGRWGYVDAAPLALQGAEGTFHDGYTPLVLRRGLHAAVLLTPDGGSEPAWFQPYLAPCPAP